MIKYNIEPWPSTYIEIGKVKPVHLTSRFAREVGAFRTAIPPYTVEPPQIHLSAERDGQPFEELLADFNMPFHVAIFNSRIQRTDIRRYSPGEKIIIPEYVVHWLINPNSERLEFTCEYAPHPWDGKKDEPEFKNLSTLLQFMEENGLMQKLK